MPVLAQEYEESRHELDMKKRERKLAGEELKTLKKDYQPIKDRHRAQEQAVEQHKAAALEETGNVRGAERRLRAEQEKMTALEDKEEEARQQLENAKKEEENRKKKIATLQNEIEVSTAWVYLGTFDSTAQQNISLQRLKTVQNEEGVLFKQHTPKLLEFLASACFYGLCDCFLVPPGVQAAAGRAGGH